MELMKDHSKPKKRNGPLTKTGNLSKWWQNFFDDIRDLSAPVGKWTNKQLLGYFCQRYLETYGITYSFSLLGSPSKCQEMFLLKQTIISLGKDNPHYVKAYIDWIFDNKVKKENVKIHSFGFIFNNQLINKFKFDYAEKTKIRRSTVLPKEFIELAQEKGIDVNSYGDLSFIKLAIDSNPEDSSMDIYKEFFNVLLGYCFDFKILDTLED